MISAQDTPSCHIPAALTTWLPDSRCTGGDKKCSALLLTFIISTSRAWTSLLQMYLCWTRSLNIIKSKGSLQIKVDGLKFHSILYPSLFHLQIVCPSNRGKCIFKLFTFTIILHLLIPWLLSFSACIVAKATLESLMSVHLICFCNFWAFSACSWRLHKTHIIQLDLIIFTTLTDWFSLVPWCNLLTFTSTLIPKMHIASTF